MKHIKLFEFFNREYDGNDERDLVDFASDLRLELYDMTKPEILVGYFFSDGGRQGGHPSIIEASMLSAIENHPSDLHFVETQKISEMPEALLSIFDANDSMDGSSVSGWIIKGISNKLSSAIVSIGGIDIYGSDNPDSREAFALAGFENLFNSKDPYAFSILAVIPNANINTVYWSDNPESGGGKLQTDYWETPYRSISLDQLLGEYIE